MSDPSPDAIVVNQLSQPVEIYLVGGLAVLPPRGRLCVAESELASAHAQALFDARIIDRLEPAAPAAKPGPKAEPETAAQATNAPEDESGEAGGRKGKRGNQ